MSDKLRLALIGCGGMAKGHSQRAVDTGKAELAAVCDLDAERMNEYTETYGAAQYTDFNTMIDEISPDAVYITTPPFVRGDLEMICIEKGLPFFIEKPVTIDMQKAVDIRNAVQDAGLITSVGYQLRYTAATQEAKQILKGKEIGMIVGRYWCGLLVDQAGDTWHSDVTKTGGQIVEQATHTLDAARYIADDITEVYAVVTKKLAGAGNSPDVNTLACKLAGGGGMTFSSTWGSGDPGDWSLANQLEVFFDKYRLSWGRGDTAVTPDMEEYEKPEIEETNIDAAFVEAVINNDPSGILSDYEDGVKSLAVSMAAVESSKRGEPVTVEDLIK